MKEFNINLESSGIRLDKFLRINFPNLKQSQIEILIRKGKIKINNKKEKSNYRLNVEDVVSIDEKMIPANDSNNNLSNKNNYFNDKIIDNINSSIIFIDENILVLNKFHGLATQGGSKIIHSLDRYLEHMFPQHSPKLVHRLDKDTTGIIIVALNQVSAAELAKIIKNRLMKKTYLCLVKGHVKKKSGEIILNLTNDYKVQSSTEGQESISYYKVLEQNKNVSLLQFNPITGRKHQIRVSCLEIGHPIIGDGKYGGSSAFIQDLSTKLHLHAYKIEIEDFFGKRISFTAPISEHFKQSIAKLKFANLYGS